MSSNSQARLPRYSSICTIIECFASISRIKRKNFHVYLDQDDIYQYRHVILDRSMISLIPKNRLMDECEWRALGIRQGSNWEHYLIHKPEPFVLMFRRLLMYRNELDTTTNVQQNNNFPTTRIPISATKNSSTSNPLNDSTNQMRRGVFRVNVNHQKMLDNSIDEEFNGSGFQSHCDR